MDDTCFESVVDNQGSFSLSGPASSEFEFFYSVSVFVTRPHILNRSIKGSELVLEPPPKFFSTKRNGVEEIEVPLDLVESLKEPYLKSTIDELKDLDVHSFTLERHFIGHSLREYVSREIWDLNKCLVVIESDNAPNKELPPFRFVCTLVKSSVDDYIMKVEIQNQTKLEVSKLMQQSVNYYLEKVVPKIIKWASCNNSLGHDSHPNRAPGVPSTSLKYVPVKAYYEEYKRLKDLYFLKLQSLWTETTDPLKFISEEMGIASYIKTYISNNNTCSEYSPFSFVDMGCGNGVLTFALAACGASGFGFDIRSRKLWDVFPHLGIAPDLRVQSFNPFCDYICHQENLWLIGNHADELTPWISVMARRFNARGFIVIPCCLFDFHGKFQRKSSIDAESLYQNYIHYIAEVGRKCGYTIKIDKLRIPSTKRICIIGTSLQNDSDENITLLQQANEYVNAKVSEFPSSDDTIRAIKVFKPRSPIEKVNNLTQLDRTVVHSIVQRIFYTLLNSSSPPSSPESSKSTTNHLFMTHPSYLKPWNRGRTDLTLAQAADLLSREERDLIQNQGKGLQTLMKNHNQIFRIKNGCLLLRRPILDDATKLSEKSILKVKTQRCFFNENHPDGCPLPSEACRFQHL